jgi:hypothetical protein
MDMYETAGYEAADIKSIIDGLEFIKLNPTDTDSIPDDGETAFIDSMFSRGQRFGATDYMDHRKDSKAQLIAKVLPNLKRGFQRLNYYGANKKPVTKCIVKGYLGGYTGWFIYPGNVSGVNRSTVGTR